ncbi:MULTISPECIES: glucose uptake protein [Enterococcus]|uniref:Glucose uptake protein n=1 Tax=Candidatus Enterococcus mangumiae TaxID=2230878 RepID=A0ABZ2SYU6_9ENTE|nr:MULTISPECIES: glucose uptake protein [unclassified Enterococcus]MBO0491338.1 glucose uptake protein [Enterococcus sp. DIV1094]MBO1300913.1 glucose uptake protein [Enterococcus sp. DIV1271a]
MDTLGQLVFYVPFFLMTALAIYYTKWTKRKVTVLIALLPVAYFSYRIFSLRHWESTRKLLSHEFGLIVSMILLILWIFYLYKHPK